MAQFKAFDSRVEVIGQTVYTFVDGMGNFKSEALGILKKNGIDDLDPAKWYSQQKWLDAFKTISENLGPTTLFVIGKKIPENAIFPPDINTIERALAAIDIAYHMNHRIGGVALFNPANGALTEGIGHYGFEKAGERKVKMVCNNPYPCEFDRGIIETMANKFRGDAIVAVAHDDGQPCRNKGGDSCTYRVTW